jgi:hypothetical protein
MSARDDDRHETETERLDRNLTELLNELRVALPGVQVLFAFLLAVPFQKGWATVTTFQQDVYFATLCLAFVTTVLLIAPTAYHRLNFRARRKRELVAVANRLAISGLATLALSLVGVMVLIADYLFSLAAALVAGGSSLLLIALLWAALPLAHDFDGE